MALPSSLGENEDDTANGRGESKEVPEKDVKQKETEKTMTKSKIWQQPIVDIVDNRWRRQPTPLTLLHKKRESTGGDHLKNEKGSGEDTSVCVAKKHRRSHSMVCVRSERHLQTISTHHGVSNLRQPVLH